MFGSYGNKFRPSAARYIPLSRNSYNHSPETGAENEIHPEVENFYEDKPLPSFSSRLFFVLLGALVVALIVGVIIDTFALTNATHLYIKGWPQSRMGIKQFAPQSKHFHQVHPNVGT